MKRKNVTEIRRGALLISGSEANIFNTEYGLYKEYHPNISKEVLLHKEEKLKNLEKNIKLQPYYPIVFYLIDSLLKEYIRGFIMEPIIGQKLNNIINFELKKEILQKAEKDVDDVTRHYKRGLITDDERYSSVIKIWEKAIDDVTEAMKDNFDDLNPIYMMAQSGARRKHESVKTNCRYAWTYGQYFRKDSRDSYKIML